MPMDTRSRDWKNRIRPKEIKASIKSEPIKLVRKSTTKSKKSKKSKIKKIRIVSAYALSKKRLTYNSLLIMLKKMATMLIYGRSMKEIMDTLSKIMGAKYRALLTRGNPDKECGAAASLATSRGEQKCPAINYKMSNFRQNQSRQSDQSGYNKNIQYNDKFPFAWIKEDIIEDNKPKKKMMKHPFVPYGKGACGDCWLCGLPVNFYYNAEFVTGCGECEHIGAISASFLTGMLTTAGLYEQVYNYGSAHAHCNQRKGQILSVKFNNMNNRWITYEAGIENIIGEIVNKDIHESEYDLEFIKAFENMKERNMKDIKKTMKNRIKEVSERWCEATNSILATYGSRHTDKIADRLCNIMLMTIEPIKDKLITTEKDVDDMEVEGGRKASFTNKEMWLEPNVKNEEMGLETNVWLKPNVKNEPETDEEWLNLMFKTNPKLMQELLSNLITSIDKTLVMLYEEADINEINELLNTDNNDPIE